MGSVEDGEVEQVYIYIVAHIFFRKYIMHMIKQLDVDGFLSISLENKDLIDMKIV